MGDVDRAGSSSQSGGDQHDSLLRSARQLSVRGVRQCSSLPGIIDSAARWANEVWLGATHTQLYDWWCPPQLVETSLGAMLHCAGQTFSLCQRLSGSRSVVLLLCSGSCICSRSCAVSSLSLSDTMRTRHTTSRGKPGQ